jgi:hypothetical protein
LYERRLAGYSKAVFICPCIDKRIGCGGFLHKLGLDEDVPIEKTKTQQIKAAIIWRLLLWSRKSIFTKERNDLFYSFISL